MNRAIFSWDTANIYHLAEHDVAPDEAEEVLLGDPVDTRFDAEGDANERWAYLGQTQRGRNLLVVTTLRGRKIRVITAYSPSWNISHE
jgi:uncharacterized DUF497 family protein